MREIPVNLVVIGAGPAGLAAALSAAKAGVTGIIMLDRQDEPGGILPQCIHNGFGLRYFNEELTGPEYAGRFIGELEGYPQIQCKQRAMAIELTPDRRVFAVSPAEGLVCYQAGAVILAMGCRERPRGALNIPGTRPAGIYTAGTLQRLMNIEGYRPGSRAVILGSGDIGLIMARRLTLEGIKVLAVLELLPYSAGLTRNLVQCLDDFTIPLLLNHTIVEIYGAQRVTGVKVAPVTADRQPLLERSLEMACDTVVLSAGLIPENELSSMAGVQLDPATGGPWVDSGYQTSVAGIFACGNVVHVHDRVDDVSEEGQTAGEAAAGFLAGRLQAPRRIMVKPGRNIRSVVPQKILCDRPSTLYIRASFPERNAVLDVGKQRIKQRVITPGETVRYSLKPEELRGLDDGDLTVSIEKGGAGNG
jgi:NADPH-dependent 2,4-dienoyl-CoA reductase/sulfur reductase-like enzyme